jgi:hypothetical protein
MADPDPDPDPCLCLLDLDLDSDPDADPAIFAIVLPKMPTKNYFFISFFFILLEIENLVSGSV